VKWSDVRFEELSIGASMRGASRRTPAIAIAMGGPMAIPPFPPNFVPEIIPTPSPTSARKAFAVTHHNPFETASLRRAPKREGRWP